MKKGMLIVAAIVALVVANTFNPQKASPTLKAPEAPVLSQYASERAFCSQWSDFCRSNGRVTPEMLRR
jgi:hypothetical protein